MSLQSLPKFDGEHCEIVASSHNQVEDIAPHAFLGLGIAVPPAAHSAIVDVKRLPERTIEPLPEESGPDCGYESGGGHCRTRQRAIISR